MRVEFAVEGAPVAKARARVVRGRAYTPEATKGYEERVTAGALNAINLGGLVMPSPREPVKANVSIGIPMPVSWSGRRNTEGAAHRPHAASGHRQPSQGHIGRLQGSRFHRRYSGIPR